MLPSPCFNVAELFLRDGGITQVLENDVGYLCLEALPPTL